MNKVWNKLTVAAIAFLVLAVQLNAQFGKNKVQYQDFDWKYIESKHFDVYYNAGSKYLAVFTAIEAEKALQSIQKTLNFTITNRIILIAYDSHNEFQQTNVIGQFMQEGIGGVTELFKNRVVVPYQGDFRQFRHVIHHELVHAVINDLFYGGTFQSAISSSTGAQLPLWMNEGLCEWESHTGKDFETDMYMRDLTISELLPPLEYLDNYLAYRGGQTFYWYVAENYGARKVGELINRMKVSMTIDAAFKSAFNMTFEEFSEKWQKDLKKYYWTDLDKFDDLDDFSAPITDRKKRRNFYNSSPAISPDGEKVAYISDKEGVFSIFIQDIDNKESAKELISSFRKQDFEDLNVLTPGISWSPDGKKLAISAKSGGEDAIFIADAVNGDYEKLTFGLRSISSVSWSPDGDKLAFIGTKGEKSDIYIYKFKTEFLAKITDDVFTDLNPLWSPDSETIYFISDRDNNTNSDNLANSKMWAHDTDLSDIYSVNITTKQIKRITSDKEYTKSAIAITSDGKKLFFTSDKNGISNIYLMNLETGEVKPRTNSINAITQLSLAKDDSKLLFCTQVKAGFDIYMIRYPLQKDLQKDTLPLTKLRENWLSKKYPELAKDTLDDEPEQVEQAISYGNFDVSFEDQQVIKPNSDVATNVKFSNEAIKGDEIDINTFKENDYKIRFTPDVVLGNPGYSTYFGFQGVTQMLFSDILGDHQIYLQANLLLDLRNSSFLVSYFYLPEIIDYQLSVFHSAGFVNRWYDGSISERPELILYRFRNWGASLSASYPFDLFRRIEWGFSWLNVSRENIDVPNSSSNISRMLFVPEARYVHDDVLYGMFAPVAGKRFFLGMKGTPKLSEDGIGFMSFNGDFRFYFPLWDYLNFAVRGTAGASFGPNPQRFFLGGTENWINATFREGGNVLPFDQPEDFAFMEFVMPLRGFTIDQAHGSKYFLTNFELRFPLFRALLAGPLPILFQSVMGAFFLDLGGAWNDDFYGSVINNQGERVAKDLLMSAGIGVRTYVFGMPLKLDIAWRNQFNTWSMPEYLFSLGYDF